MNAISLSNPVFAAYAIAASLMVLKVVAMSWLTVWKMMSARSGFRSPEDLRKTPLNPKPKKSQLALNENVERVRRIQQNDLENVPFFLLAGFLYVLTAPPLWLAQVLFYGYAISRFAHFAAYYTAQTHDMRATLWTIGSLIIVFMSVRVVWVAVGTAI
jgi:glutathione S-transferase